MANPETPESTAIIVIVSKPMRLLFVSNLFPDAQESYRGLDNAVLLQELSKNHDVQVVALRPTLFGHTKRSPRPIDQKLHPVYVPSRYVPKIGSRWNHRLMKRALRPHLAERAFDVALVSWLYPDACALSALAQEFGFPFVAIAQGSDAHQYLKDRVRRTAIVDAMRHCSALITRSAELARLLADAGVERTRLHTIYNGVDLEMFRPGKLQEERSKLGLPHDQPIVLFVGNFVDIKNPLLLLEAHKRLPQKPLLVMIGGGPLRSRLIGENVLVAGRKSPAEVAAYMRAANLLCLPSANEGVPNVILEAFSSGLPVVASRVGGIPEVHQQELLGALVRAGDVDDLTRALADVLQRPTETERIRAHALRFSWQNAATAYDQLLQEAAR